MFTELAAVHLLEPTDMNIIFTFKMILGLLLEDVLA